MGLDLALRETGAVILSEYGSLLRNMTFSYHLVRVKGKPIITEAQRVERLINLTNDIISVVKQYKVRYVALEGYAHNKFFQAHQIGEIVGNVKVQLWLNCQIIADIVPPLTGRKHFFGYGGIDKKQCLDILVDKLGFSINNTHESDAYIVARYLWDFVVYKNKL